MLESKYQTQLIDTLRERFPGCVIMKNDASYQQGFLDLTIFWCRCWAALEVKGSIDAVLQPNQEYFVEKLDEMSFAAIICPENEEEVLTALQETFASRGCARVS